MNATHKYAQKKILASQIARRLEQVLNANPTDYDAISDVHDVIRLALEELETRSMSDSDTAWLIAMQDSMNAIRT